MLLDRNVKASVRAWLVALLASPSATYVTAGINTYNVYGETEMRDEDHVNVRVYPWIYVTDGAIPYEEKQVPAAVIDIDVMAATGFELGNRNRLRIWDCAIHVWGADRGERDDLKSYIEASLDTISIYDYTDQDNPVLLETVEVDPDIGASTGRVSDEQSKEGTLENWGIITFAFETMTS